MQKKKRNKNLTIIPSSMLLLDTDKTKETKVKLVSKFYHSRVLRHVKAQHSQLSHMN